MLKTSALKHLTVLVLAVAGLAQAAPVLPADPRFDQPVTVGMIPGGIDLESLLRGLASSVSLNMIAEGIPAKKVNYEISGKPFRQVWELLVTLNNLDFELQANDIVLVGPTSVVSRVRPAPPAPPAPTPPPAPVAQAAPPAPPEPPAPPPPVAREFYTLKFNVPAVTAFLRAELPGLVVNAVTGSQVISVTGTAAQQAEVRTLLAQVDLAPPPPVVVERPVPPRLERRVFRLSNTDAVRLAAVLKEAVTGAAGAAVMTAPTTGAATANTPASTTTTTLPGAANLAPTETDAEGNAIPITITADEGSNSLIVSGTPAQIETIAQLLPQLDQRQQLVNVNVRIQEVSDSAARNLGIDWSFGIGNFAGKILSGGLGFLVDATRSLAGLNIGAALNALESQRLSKRINDTTVTVLNNGTGRVNSGGRIEVSLAGTGGNNISKTLEYGVIVEVKPVVSADGTILLTLNAEISDVLNKGTLNPNRIDFDRSASETTVRLATGQTVLLGSLLQTRSDETSSGVPILSAIPLIGELFKTRGTTDEQRQLLIVVTADIIR